MLYKKIDIGDKTYMMCSAASVNICYYNIFREDFLSLLDMNHPEAAIMPFMKMAFVMAKVGELGRKQANTMTQDDYEDWLDEFTFADLMAAMEEIQMFYLDASRGDVDSKKNENALSES